MPRKITLNTDDFLACARKCAICRRLATHRSYDDAFCDRHSSEGDYQLPLADAVRGVQKQLDAIAEGHWRIVPRAASDLKCLTQLFSSQDEATFAAARVLPQESYEIVQCG